VNSCFDCFHFLLACFFSHIFLYCHVADLIEVNIRRPEKNREVLVFDVKDIPGVTHGTVFSGYYIFLPMDIRFTLDDYSQNHYTARVCADHQVLITLPAWPYSLLYNRDQMSHLGNNVLDSMDEARHDYNDNTPARMLKHIVLEFPTGHVLSSKEIFERATEDEKLALEIVPVAYVHPLMPTLNNTIHYACWKVARVDLKASKRGKIEQKQQLSEAAEQLAALLKRTTIATPAKEGNEGGGAMEEGNS
jgi:hypothetical protein